ncbi:MAG: hypothetical protein IJJ15_07595 [Ruminococcus sp.]|nr:hypothetical protein [Ruminococcus sp.]
MKHPDKKTLTIIVAVVSVLLIAGIVTTAAIILRDTSGIVTETFAKADVTCEVNDDYTVTNTSNIPALIRVKVIVNMTDGDEIIPGDVPSYTVNSGWTEIDDYIYYNAIVSEKDDENVTTAPITFDTSADDIQVLVLAEAIQAASTAASEEWGVSFSDGSWS